VSELSRDSDDRIRLGVSSCLLGNEVRFDGGDKRDRFLTDQLGDFVEWVPVCPEVEAGFGTPRPSMRLVQEGDAIRVKESRTGRDHTRKLETWSARRARSLRPLGLSGYILKKDSPSCGMTRVKIFSEAGMPRRAGRGVFAAALLEAYPGLPVEDEGRLNDAGLRENFIERVFAYRRLRGFFRGRWMKGQLVAFHTRHKLQLMAHSPAAYRELGRLVAAPERMDRAAFRAEYETAFMAALEQRATRGRNANVLQHAAGHLKKRLDSAARTELSDLIHDYRRGTVPLVVPLVLMRHHVREHEVEYLEGQHFLEPHPKELMLRNHV